MVLADSGRISRVPPYLGTQSGDTFRFRLRDCHPLWSDFPVGSPTEAFLPGHPQCAPQPRFDSRRTGLGCSAFARHYSRNRCLLSLPPGTEMFHFPGFASCGYGFTAGYGGITRRGFPHSDVHGSKPGWRLPVAYRSHPRPSSPPRAKASTTRP